MCFAVIVGKDASVDGSVLFGHNEQNFDLNVINYRRIPRIKYNGKPINLKNGGEVQGIDESYSYLWAESPGLEFSDNYFNEWGVAVAGDGCPTREDLYEELVARGDIQDGGIGYMLPRLVAMQAKSAREGVELAADLLYKFGYTASGRSLTIADSQEAWVMSIARGKRYIAERVPDDSVVIVPNVHVIGAEANLDDHDNLLASPGLVDYAVERGWYNPTEGPFSFRKVFSANPHPGTFGDKYGCDVRQWHGQALLTGEHADIPVTSQLPFAVKATKKLSVEDVAEILRAHLEDTRFDYARENSVGTPHRKEEEIDYCLARSICNIATQESVIFQLRSWLPKEIGCVAWRASSVPCTSVYTPWYLGIHETPSSYYKPCSIEEHLDLHHHFNPDRAMYEFDENFAFWLFLKIGKLVEEKYSERIKPVTAMWREYEAELLAAQSGVDETALEFGETSSQEMKDFLNDYCMIRAFLACNKAQALLDSFEGEE